MAVSSLPGRVRVRFVVALVAAMIACSHRDSAQAFDFFGLWGSDESPPPVSRTAEHADGLEGSGGEAVARRKRASVLL